MMKMTLANFNLEIDEKETINKITSLAPVREKAFFTIMRQSGLTPSVIKELKIEDIEPTLQTPCKINNPEEDYRTPVFIGAEGVRYIRQYLATKESLAPENPLFSARNKPNKKIDTKDISRTFRVKAEEATKGKNVQLKLCDLVVFYQKNAKYYLKKLKEHPLLDHESYRTMYKIHALPFLEIETQISVPIRAPKNWFHKKIENLNDQIREKDLIIARDNEYIGSILSLLYDNKGNLDTGENIKLGDNFVKLWQRASDLQLTNNVDFLNGRSKYVPCVDILEELTKTLEKILKPYEKQEKRKKNPNNSNLITNNLLFCKKKQKPLELYQGSPQREYTP